MLLARGVHVASVQILVTPQPLLPKAGPRVAVWHGMCFRGAGTKQGLGRRLIEKCMRKGLRGQAPAAPSTGPASMAELHLGCHGTQRC